MNKLEKYIGDGTSEKLAVTPMFITLLLAMVVTTFSGADNMLFVDVLVILATAYCLARLYLTDSKI